MIRKLFIGIMVVMSFLPYAMGIPLTGEQERTLKHLASEYNKVKSFGANFQQTDSTGKTLDGRLILKRPGKLRMQYDSPSKAALIVDTTAFVWIDQGGKRNLPLAATPLGLIIQKNFSFFNKDIKITSYEETAYDVTVGLYWRSHPNQGALALTMSKMEPVVVKGWTLRNANEQETKVRLYNYQFNIRASRDLFFVNNPRPWPKSSS